MNIFIFSGCGWSDCGGGQRPVQLAREFCAMGHRVLYYSALDPDTVLSREGVTVVGKDDIFTAVNDLRSVDGVAIVGLPNFYPAAKALRDAGWVVIYDLLDDWDGFIDAGDLDAEVVRRERDLLEISSAVVATAPALCDRVVRMGSKADELIRNGGPAELLERRIVTETAVYSGHLAGSWLDAECLLNLDDGDVPTRIIGDHVAMRDKLDGPNLHCYGEMEYWDNMVAMSQSVVGVIPFSGELCLSVDPIKMYDYIAAGLTVVHTPEMIECLGNPFAVVASSSEFGDVVKDAINAPWPEEVALRAGFVEGNSWAKRAEQYMKVIDRVASKSPATPVAMLDVPDAPSPTEAKTLDRDDVGIRLTINQSQVCDMHPPCEYCVNQNSIDYLCSEQVFGGEHRFMSAVDAHLWLDALDRIARKHGRMFASFCFGEPMADPMVRRLMGALANDGHMIDVVSNIVQPIDTWREFAALMPDPRSRDNVGVATSFHPHYWLQRNAPADPSIALNLFLSKRLDIRRETGFRVGTAIVIGHPDWIDDGSLERWVETLISANVHHDVIHFDGFAIGGKYPEAYTLKQREKLRELMGPSFDVNTDDMIHNWQPGRYCRSGADYVNIAPNGDILRCAMGGRPLGNILDGDDVTLNHGPTPCPFDACPCPGMWEYLMPEDYKPDVWLMDVLEPPWTIKPAEMYDRHRRLMVREGG